jgi:hypothetical protein
MFDPIDPGEPMQPNAEKWQPLTPPAEAGRADLHHPKLGDPSRIWAYRDKAAQLEGYICRFETTGANGTPSKTFLPRRWGKLVRNGIARAGWNWKGWGVASRPLYGLCELLVRPDAPVLIVEGEKKVEAARRLFPEYVAVSPMNGAKSPHKSDWTPVAGHPCFVWPDNDGPGSGFAVASASLATAVGAASVAIVTIPQDWPDGWDIADAPPDGVTVERLRELLKAAPPYSPSPQPGTGEDAGKTQAAVLIRLAAKADLFHTADRIGYADVVIANHRETWPILSSSFKGWLAHAYYQHTGGAPNSEAMRAARAIMDAKAQFDCPERAVFVRVAENESKIYIDLADEQWRAVEIDTNGWRICDKPPVRFRRSRGMRPLPVPIGGGFINDLKPFLNTANEDDFVLAVSWALAAMRPRGPYPILAVGGEAGAAKTTLIRVLRTLIDPAVPPLRRPPHRERDIFIAGNNSHIVAYDNLSRLVDWLSDTLCVLATGGGAGTRKLWSDDEEAIFDAMKPVAISAIENIVIRGDAADRCVFLTLPIIPDYRDEMEFWASFEHNRPSIFGALLDAIVHGLRKYPETRLAKRPRMADFARWGAACEEAFWEKGRFMQAYAGNRQEAVEALIEDDKVAQTLRGFMESLSKWEGTVGGLLEELRQRAGEKVAGDDNWPKTTQGMTGRLRRIAPPLRKLGIDIKRADRSNKSRKIIITSTTPADIPESSSPSSPRHQTCYFNGLEVTWPNLTTSLGTVEHVTDEEMRDVVAASSDVLFSGHVTGNRLKSKAGDVGDVRDANFGHGERRARASTAKDENGPDPGESVSVTHDVNLVPSDRPKRRRITF